MLKIVKPTEKDKKKYIEMITEWQEYWGPYVPCIVDFSCNNNIRKFNYNDLLKLVENYSKWNIAEDDVDYFEKSDFYFIYDENELVGVWEVRHNLKELGKKTLGHIACGIRPSKRKQGYATLAAKEMINILKKDEIKEAVLCHYEENKISPKIINEMNFTYSGSITSKVSGKKIYRYTKKI